MDSSSVSFIEFELTQKGERRLPTTNPLPLQVPVVSRIGCLHVFVDKRHHYSERLIRNVGNCNCGPVSVLIIAKDIMSKPDILFLVRCESISQPNG